MPSYDYSALSGRMVRIERGGHESRKGRLLYVGPDYVALQTENEGVVYYSTDHIKSVTLDTKDHTDLLPPSLPVLDEQAAVTPQYVEADSFKNVLETMKTRWVQINRGGPESVQGVITDVHDDHVALVTNHEMIMVFLYHIKSCGYIPTPVERKDENKDESKDGNKKEEKKQGKR